MFTVPALHLKDGYKVGHPAQYQPGTTKIYSNLTPRNTRIPEIDRMVCFGMQYFVKDFLVKRFNETFFDRPLDAVLKQYKRRIDHYLGKDAVNLDHIADLHKLGYLPLHMKALPEGTTVPMRTPVLTLTNTVDHAFWLPNSIETIMSSMLWHMMTSASIARHYRRTFDAYALKTGGDVGFAAWQGHDFSMRGLDPDAAITSGAGHLLSFYGTDTVPAIDFLEEYYGADCEKELIGGSVPATEHSVMCMGSQVGEFETFKRLITETYPKGIVSIVSDTWDYWKVLTEFLPRLKQEIMARDGKVVIRPDSGDPVKIICGDSSSAITHVRKGSIATLWETFGGTVTPTGHKQLDSHIGLIYGDSITMERQQQILSGLDRDGFASTNVVLGIGSYTYQHVTRDTFGLAMKATYGDHRDSGPQVIWKDPATDDGTKRSARGLLHVKEDGTLVDEVTWEMERTGLLQTVFIDGQPANFQTLAEVRERLSQEP